nr:unnamed protein product [Callosobruchus chinensis]
MLISDELKSDINGWIENLAINNNELTHDKYVLEIFSDASDSGWGIYCDKISSYGFWSTLFFGLKCFAAKLTNGSILCRLDNATPMSYVKKMRSVQFPKLNILARKICSGVRGEICTLLLHIQKSEDNKE